MSNRHPLIESADNLIFHVDSLSLPEGARSDFESGARRSFDFLQTLPGFRGHLDLEKTGGPGAFNIVTLAGWASKDAHDRAVAAVTEYYQRIGFDRAATLARWGARTEAGQFRALEIA